LSASNQKLIGLSASTGPKGVGPGADVDRLLRDLDCVLETAAGLAAPLLCLDVGPLPAPKREEKPQPKVTPEMAGLLIIPTAPKKPEIVEPGPAPDPAFAAQVDGVLIELGRRADRYGVTVAMRSELSGFSALHRALLASACPWFGIDLDPTAMLRDEWEVDEVFSRLGSLIRHTRGRDAIKGQGGRTQPAVMGKGDVRWEEIMQRLDEAGYAGPITVDPMELADRVAAARAGASHLRENMT
jgi:sugar phosphate isomerase/epimerase